ncbi:MAG TPA: ComEC/Rec2 family competence protein [Candidatus Acidoferrales bacterium]|nr:ComEC/Rec2 family competence protein [Candidatus Acidoferrales bacterium]
MKAPAVWIALFFAAGILLWPVRIASPAFWLVIVAILILGAVLCLRFLRSTWPAWIVALAAWGALGGASATLEHRLVPANSAARIVAEKRIDTSEPLRWRGRLREDPLRLDWGARYEIELESVESGGREVAIKGGVRLNYYANPRQEESLPQVRAGDRVEALARVHAPRNFLDPGAFDTRASLAREGIDLIGTLRNTDLFQKIETPRLGMKYGLARTRGALLAQLDSLYAAAPEQKAILRAMLLGDRMFVDSDVATEFQKTGAYHVLVVAGLHVGALCAFLLWVGRKLRMPPLAIAVITSIALLAYVDIVQNRPPILRAALMAAIYLAARMFFRRVELLNTVALAGLAVLYWRPSELRDDSFQLSFLAAGVIAGLAVPWLVRSVEPYFAGLSHLGDVTRDPSHPPKVAQFRLDLRRAAAWISARIPAICATPIQLAIVAPLRAALRIWELIFLSLSLQIGMLALIALDFHRVSIAGPLSNVPAVFLTGLIVPLGYVTLGMSFIWRRAANVLASTLGLLGKLLLTLVHWFASLPHMSYRIPSPPGSLMLAWLLALAILCAIARANVMKKPELRRQSLVFPQPRVPRSIELLAAACVALTTIAAATHPFAPRLVAGEMEVTVLDVGQGDSIFAAFPNGQTMLIDGGGEAGSELPGHYRAAADVGEEVVAPYLWSRGIKRLDIVALTHSDQDHVDGLRAVLNDFRVGQLWVGADADKRSFRELIAQARKAGIPITHQSRQNEFDLGAVHGDVIWPDDTTELAKNLNNSSLVLRLRDGQSRFLLTGDIEQKAEKEMIASGEPLQVDFLKVPHHGSKTSSTEDFLAAVAPRIAVISVGEGNMFGHPNAAVLERYEKIGARILRTDRDGAVTAMTDGKNLRVTTYRESNPHD